MRLTCRSAIFPPTTWSVVKSFDDLMPLEVAVDGALEARAVLDWRRSQLAKSTYRSWESRPLAKLEMEGIESVCR